MKMIGPLLSAAFFSFNLSAQDIPKSASPAAAPPVPTFPVLPPLSKLTLEKLNSMTPIFNGRTLEGWKASARTNVIEVERVWTVKDGVMASLGDGRGVLFTEKAYGNYRLVFKMRHVSGQPDHQACFLIYCTAPRDGTALDALAGIQFQPPNGGTWDYRPGKNNSGKDFFTRLPHPKFDSHEWSQVEILVHTNGTARMAVAQPVGTRAYEVLAFNDPTAGKIGPIAWQMHNQGLFDEYTDVRLEVDPKENKLVTTE